MEKRKDILFYFGKTAESGAKDFITRGSESLMISIKKSLCIFMD